MPPHCTLATEVEEPTRVIDVVGRFDLPVLATATSVHLVEVPVGQSHLEAR